MKIFRSFIAAIAGLMMVACTTQTVPQKDAHSQASDEVKEKSGDTEEKAKADDETAANKDTESNESVVPTPEQQEAAEKVLAETADESAENTATEADGMAPEAVDQSEETEIIADTTVNTSGIPGRNSLRMGRYAPPEEAVSAGAAQAPRPNRAEQHGFRSPSLPSGLPMDINGKLTGKDKN